MLYNSDSMEWSHGSLIDYYCAGSVVPSGQEDPSVGQQRIVTIPVLEGLELRSSCALRRFVPSDKDRSNP